MASSKGYIKQEPPQAQSQKQPPWKLIIASVGIGLFGFGFLIGRVTKK
jgi:hypothetical protein